MIYDGTRAILTFSVPFMNWRRTLPQRCPVPTHFINQQVELSEIVEYLNHPAKFQQALDGLGVGDCYGDF